MSDRESSLSAANSDSINIAEVTDQNFFEKLSIGHKLQNFKDQIDEHSITEYTEQNPGEINFLEESKLDPNKAFQNKNHQILVDLSRSGSGSNCGKSDIFKYKDSIAFGSEENSPRVKKNKIIFPDSESETFSKRNTFGQSMKGLSQELKNLRPIRDQTLDDKRDSYKGIAIPRIERASTLGNGSKKRTWAGQLTLKYVDNPSIGILDLSNRSRSFGRIKNKLDSPQNDEKNERKETKTASRIKKISGYQNKEEGAFLMREMMEKKKISKKKKKKKIKKISKTKDKLLQNKKIKKNVNLSKNDLTEGIFGKSKIKGIQRSTSNKKKLKEKSNLKKSNRNSKTVPKSEKRMTEKRKTRKKSTEKSKNEKIQNSKTEKNSKNESLENKMKEKKIEILNHERENTKPNFEIFAGKFPKSEVSSLEKALEGYQKNLEENRDFLEPKSNMHEQTKRNGVSGPYFKNINKISDKIRLGKEKLANQEIEDQRNYITKLKNQIFQLEQSINRLNSDSNNELKEFNTYLSRIYKENSSLEELRGSELKIAHEKIFELISQIKKRDEILEKVHFEKQRIENEKNSNEIIFQDSIKDWVEKIETKERIALAVKREFEEKNQELLETQAKNQDLTREIEILEAIVGKYKEKEIYQASLEKKNSELETEIERLLQENRKLHSGMKVCGFIEKENSLKIGSDNEENDEYFNRVELESKRHQRAMLAMAQEHDQILTVKNQEIRILQDEIEKIKASGNNVFEKHHFETVNNKIMFVKEKGTQTEIFYESIKTENKIDFENQAVLVSKYQTDLVRELTEVVLKVQDKLKDFGILRESDNLKIILQNFLSDYANFNHSILKIESSKWETVANSLTQNSILCKSSLSEAQSCLEIFLGTLRQNFDNLQLQTDRFAEEVAELSSRNQIINQELDKIMDQLPKSQKAREEELRKVQKELREEKKKFQEICQKELDPLKIELREYKEILAVKNKQLADLKKMRIKFDKLKGVEKEKSEMESVLKKIRQEVLPSLKTALEKEKKKSQELDQIIHQMNQENMIPKNILSNVKKDLNILEIQRITQVFREIRTFRPRWYVERVPSYLHYKNYSKLTRSFNTKSKSTQTLPPTTQSGDLHESSKKTELKQKLNCSESFQEMRTVSTNKDKSIKVISSQNNLPFHSKIINIKKKGKAQVFVENDSKRDLILETLQKQLKSAHQKIQDLERLKKKFKKCRRCLVENQELLDEEKRKLILGRQDRREKWRREREIEKKSQAFSPEMSKVLFQCKGSEKQLMMTRQSGQSDFLRRLRDKVQKTEGSEPVKISWELEKKDRVMSETSGKGQVILEDHSIESNSNYYTQNKVIPDFELNGMLKIKKDFPNPKSKKNIEKRRKKTEKSIKKTKNDKPNKPKKQINQNKNFPKEIIKNKNLKIGLRLEKFINSKINQKIENEGVPSSSLEADMIRGFMSMPKGFTRSKKNTLSKEKHSKEISTQRKNSRVSYKSKNDRKSNISKKKSLEPNTNQKNLYSDRKKRVKSFTKNRKNIERRENSKKRTQRVLGALIQNPKTRKNGSPFDFYFDSQFNSDLYALISQNSKNSEMSGNQTGKRKDSRNKQNRMLDSKSSKGSLSKKKKSKSKKKKTNKKLKIKTHKNLDFRAILDKSQIRKMIEANFKSRDHNDAHPN